MSKKKAIVCTILFAVVVMSIWASLFFIGDAWQPVSCSITGIWISDTTLKFYRWLLKEN